jgi:hypothetical protein
MPPRDHRSGEHADPALVLAVREVIDEALEPVLRRLDASTERLAKGDTAIALLNQRCDAIDAALEPRTDRAARKQPSWLLVALVSGALSSVGSIAAIWFLSGVGQAAAKASP